jgi:aryl-alcohol dehydrogenase-like predicted oxidoreductase
LERRSLGTSGLNISCLSLGTANFGEPTPEHDAARMVEVALDAGITLFDSADSYANGLSESFLGNALARSGRRDHVTISSKVLPPASLDGAVSSRLHIIRACEDSLRRLKTDRIDVYQVHRPFLDPVEETLEALTQLVRQGKVRYIGSSTHPAWRVMEAIMLSEVRGLARYVSEQPPYNLLDRRIENELVPLCQKYELGLIPWSPTAMGVLAGRYADANAFPPDSRAALRGGIYAERVTARGIQVARGFAEVARRFDLTPAQMAVLWVKEQTGVTSPIIGVRTPAQLEELLVVADMRLSDDAREACDELVPPGTAVANFHNTSGWMQMKTFDA